VLGIDLSPEMIRLARQQEQAEPLGITYQVGDATTLPQLGPFDLVTAVYLLNYAASMEQLRGMFRSIYANLVAGGRFIAYTINPAFTLDKPNCTPYGLTVLSEAADTDRYLTTAQFNTEPPTRFTYSRWSQAAYEGALQAAGFREFAWHPSEVAPADVAHYGAAYWRDFYDNCLVIGLVCRK
jgi:SAM-dependent methyltransferase